MPIDNSGSNPAANLRGLSLMAVGFFFFATSDTIAKFLTGVLHPLQIVWFRQLGLMSVALVLLLWMGPSLLRTASPKLQIARGALAVMSSVCFVFAIRHAPLADTVAVTFVAPFLVTIMGVVFLGEQVGVRRWSAIGLGFLGAIIIIRPGMGVFHPAIFLVLIAAVFFSARQILSRALAASDRTQTTIVYTALVSVSILLAPMPWVWQWPESGSTYLLIVAMATLAAFGEILIIRSLEIAQATVLAPTHYTLIVWATFYGWLIFDQLPDHWTWLGTSIILATGVYLIYRERIVKGHPSAG